MTSSVVPDWLAHFCYKGPRKGPEIQALTQPWTSGGHTWCTNFAIVLRLDPLLAIPDQELAPRGLDVMWTTYPSPSVEDFHNFPTLPPDAGRQITCTNCEGTGVTECGCCTSSIPCDECNGQGKKVNDRWVELNGVAFKLNYLALIAAHLPRPIRIAVCSTSPPTAGHSPQGYMCFRFKGGDGILTGLAGRPPGLPEGDPC